MRWHFSRHPHTFAMQTQCEGAHFSVTVGFQQQKPAHVKDRVAGAEAEAEFHSGRKTDCKVQNSSMRRFSTQSHTRVHFLDKNILVA